MIFKEMDPDEVLKQLEGHPNVIKPELEKISAYFEKLECLRCRGTCRPVVNNKQLFEKSSILPNFLAECNDCGMQFSPYTKIEVSPPNRNPLDP